METFQTFQETRQRARLRGVLCAALAWAGGCRMKKVNEDKIKSAEIRLLNGVVRVLKLQKIQEKNVSFFHCYIIKLLA